jgi:hypothetical protein
MPTRLNQFQPDRCAGCLEAVKILKAFQTFQVFPADQWGKKRLFRTWDSEPMEIQAIALARVVWLLEVQGIDPRGRASTPELLRRFWVEVFVHVCF